MGNILLVGVKEKEKVNFSILNEAGQRVKNHLPLSGKGQVLSKEIVEKISTLGTRSSRIRFAEVEYFSYATGLIQSAFVLTDENQNSFDLPNPTLVVFKLKSNKFF